MHFKKSQLKSREIWFFVFKKRDGQKSDRNVSNYASKERKKKRLVLLPKRKNKRIILRYSKNSKK